LSIALEWIVLAVESQDFDFPSQNDFMLIHTLSKVEATVFFSLCWTELSCKTQSSGNGGFPEPSVPNLIRVLSG
jgi:hypothetical protein